MALTIGILKESDSRVAIVPDSIKDLQKLGLTLQLVKDAGTAAGFPDDMYTKQKAKVVTKPVLLSKSDIIVSLNPISSVDQLKLKADAVLISRYAPYDNKSKVKGYVKKNHTLFSLDMIPRITVAQSSDVLSSLASIAGYKAVLIAANTLTRYYPMLTTAAGSIPPAKVLVIGAGVAGLQAIATARRLGAVVEASDTRAAAKDEVKSLGAKFVEVEGATDDTSAGGYAVEQTEEYKKKQKEAIAASVARSDVVIATAQLRGKPAPKIITKAMVESMKPGGVIVDLASSTGGNCELSKDNKTIKHKGITIIGDSDLSEQVASHASVLYSKNVFNFIKFMLDEKGKLEPTTLTHEVVEKSCIVHKGQLLYKEK